MSLSQKRSQLESILKDYRSMLVAFSGGVDSTLVLAMGKEVLGKDHVVAATAFSDSVPEREKNASRDIAHSLGVRHRIVLTKEMQNPDYVRNPDNRCFYCKSELYSTLQPVAEEEGLAVIANGTNVDDLGDYRPGLIAAKEASIKSPLSKAGFTKHDVRELSKSLGLSTWEKPAMPCLSSRIPYGQEVTTAKLKMIEEAEDYLMSLGYSELRVRHFGNRAHLELPPESLEGFLAGDHWMNTQSHLKGLGFEDVFVDPEGFRSGKLNDALKIK